MAQIETWLNQDMMQAVKVRYLDGNLFSQDNAGNLIGVLLTRDGVDYSGGGTVSANVIRADGGTVAVTGALSGNVATVVLPQSAYAVPGVVSIVVKLTVSGAIITIAAVVANIYQSSTETAIDPGTIIPSIQTLINQINTAVASIPADYSSLWATLAPAFSTSTAYTAGQYVTYNGGLYRFTANHAAGAWSSSDVSAAVLGNELSDLKNEITFEREYVDFNISGTETYSEFVQGAWSTSLVISSNANRCASKKYFLVKKGNSFSVTCNTTGVKFAIAGKYVESGNTYDSGWKTGTYKLSSVLDDCYLFVNVATSAGNTPIAPNDFTATITRTDNSSKLHDAYLEIAKDSGMLETEDYVVNGMHNFVNYGYDEYYKNDPVIGASDSSALGIQRAGQIVILNGGGIDKDIVLKLDKPLSRTVNSSTVKGWTKTILFRSNHKYKLTAKWISGTISGVENPKCPTVSVYTGNSSASTIGYGYYTDEDKEFVRFVDGEDIYCSVCLYIPAGYTCTNAKILVLMEDIVYDVSNQYLEEMVDTVNKVRTENSSPCLIFPWVTDIHRYSVSTQTFLDMIANMKTFTKAVKCDFILNTGDTIDGNKSQDVSLGYAYDSIGAFKEIGEPFFYAQGNHDNNPYISSGALVFTLKQVFGGFFAATKGVTFNVNENGTDYYFDFKNIGVRVISLNSCNSSVANTYAYGESTAEWLVNALETDNTVIFATHVSPISAHVWNNNSPTNKNDIASALSAFVANGGRLILLTGHSHIDAEFIDPFVEITDVCQKFEKADTSTSNYEDITGEIKGLRNPDRDSTTYTADAWTVAMLKPIEKILALIRFGAGVDRYVHYEQISPQSVETRLTGTITWSSSDSSVAIVSNGVITGVSTGKCAIIATDENGNFEYWIVNVT